MTRTWLIKTLIGIIGFGVSGTSVEATTTSVVLTDEQDAMVAHAVGQFQAHGLNLPEVAFVFHDSLFPCHGHKGMYHKTTRTLEMCSMDRDTLLHELVPRL